MRISRDLVLYVIALSANVWVRLTDELPERLRVALLTLIGGLAIAFVIAAGYPVVRAWGLDRWNQVGQWTTVVMVLVIVLIWHMMIRLRIARPPSPAVALVVTLVCIAAGAARPRPRIA